MRNILAIPVREMSIEDRRAYQREQYARTRQATLARKRKWREDNQDKVKAMQRTWLEEKWPEYYLENKPSIQQYGRKWTQENPEKKKAAKLRRLSKFNGTLSHSDIKALKSAYDGICDYCLKPCETPEIEHCVPISKGGLNSLENCVLACRSCNAKKHDKTPLEFLTNWPKLDHLQ